MGRYRGHQTRLVNLVTRLLDGHRVHWRQVEVERVMLHDIERVLITFVWQVTVEVGLPMHPVPYRHLQDLEKRWHFNLRVWTAEDGPAVLEA